jgi:hypothetical protein
VSSSGTLLLDDPAFWYGPVQLQKVAIGRLPVHADVLQYSKDHFRVAKVSLEFAPGQLGSRELVGEVGVDSASVVIIDALTRDNFWKEEGAARLGVFSSPNHRKVAELVSKQFGVRSIPINAVRSEMAAPVTPELENQITEYLKTIPEYADYPFIYFRVETKNTYELLGDRLLKAPPWCELILDDQSGANCIAFESGFGDGKYPVWGYLNDGQLVKAEIEFIENAAEPR